ncbi:TPA: DUF3757 domain-containing protein [Yersinia enterocolitica]|nr:DUF3757 domain-containing protein [Yersinia enterocolitica]
MMKYKLPFALLLIPFGAFATLHCPAIDTIKYSNGVYNAHTADVGEWGGTLQGDIPHDGTIKSFHEALLILNSDGGEDNIIDQGRFQKCTYNLQAEGKLLDMYFDNKTWRASISGKPYWQYQQTPFFELYRCSGVAPELCEFDIMLPAAP